MSLGKKLKRLRESKGITLRQLELATGVSNPYLSQLETGKVRNPSAVKLKNLADFYGLTLESLLDLRVEKSKDVFTDCRTREGRNIILIDALIGICRVLAEEDLSSENVQSVLRDFRNDENVKFIFEENHVEGHAFENARAVESDSSAS